MVEIFGVNKMVIAHMSRRLLSLPPDSEYHDVGQEDPELLGFIFIYKKIINYLVL